MHTAIRNSAKAIRNSCKSINYKRLYVCSYLILYVDRDALAGQDVGIHARLVHVLVKQRPALLQTHHHALSVTLTYYAFKK